MKSANATGGPEYAADLGEVYREELTSVKARRQKFGVAADKLNGGKPAVSAGLVGLAFSGGGIRSAIFNLGLLRALSKKNILRFVDYLSTVSGGGYIGSCLSSLLTMENTSVLWGREFPFYFNPDENGEERDEVKHLRRYANYLMPDGIMSRELFRMIGTYISGLALTLLMPFALVIAFAYCIRSSMIPAGAMHVLLAMAGVSLVAVLTIRMWYSLAFIKEGPLDSRQKVEIAISFFTIVLLGSAALAGLIALGGLLVTFNAYVSAWLHGLTLTALAGLLAGVVKLSEPRMRKIVAGIFRIAWVIIVPVILVELYMLCATTAIFDSKISLAGVQVPVLIIIALLAFIAGCFVNTNRITLHGYYRDRLSRTFMIANKGGKVESNDRCKLSELHKHNNGPLHLVVTTINIPSTDKPEVRGRKGDIFFFSKSYCGAESTGFRKTGKYYNDKCTLTTAMAISGAAIASQMGHYSNPVLSFLLTLLNFRLNRWIPNPKNKPWANHLVFRPWYMLKELFNLGSEKALYLNASDGGHIENNGLYSLLKRRCKYIIVSDAGEDPGFSYNDLAVSLRRARIDLGVDIDIKLDGLRPDKETGFTRLRYAVGKIMYPEKDEQGYLVYVQSTLIGDEPEDILSYKRHNPRFPDQSTLDQFFDEAQFESYRKLGDMTGQEVFVKVPEKQEYTDADIETYFRELYLQYEEKFMKKP
jgi:hypothetical protein